MSPRGASPPSHAPPHPGELGFAGLRPRQGECSEGREPLGTGWVLRWPLCHCLSPLGCGDEQESRDLFTGKRLREAQKKQK